MASLAWLLLSGRGCDRIVVSSDSKSCFSFSDPPIMRLSTAKGRRNEAIEMSWPLTTRLQMLNTGCALSPLPFCNKSWANVRNQSPCVIPVENNGYSQFELTAPTVTVYFEVRNGVKVLRTVSGSSIQRRYFSSAWISG